MHLSKFQLIDYASFADSGTIELDAKMNLFIGVNNSGKSSLLKSLVYPLEDNQHKLADGSHTYRAAQTKIRFQIAIDHRDLRRRLALADIAPSYTAGSLDGHNRELVAFLNHLNDDLPLRVDAIRHPGKAAISDPRGSIPEYRHEGNRPRRVQLKETEDGKWSHSGGSQKDTLAEFFDAPASSSIFYFGPQRLNVGSYKYGLETQLDSNASNLPAVLFYISANFPEKFDTIEKHLRDIMPGVGKVRISPSEEGYEIRIFPDGEGVGAISFGLDNSGTGIGQLLAILTAVVIHDQAIIVIDEISTFLHTTASKKLISLLQTEYSQHQYIVSTHSAEVIFSAICPRIFKIWRNGLESRIELVQLETAKDAREIANYLGFSMLDVFGNERMIWVEGPTEVICFPQVLRAHEFDLGSEIGFAAVQVPSLFSDRKAKHKQVELIYSNAGKNLAPLLKGMAFGLDREDLGDDAVAKAERSKRKVKFLPRRCLENYLLSPRHIAKYLRSMDEEISSEDALQAIEGLVEKNGYKAKSKWTGDIENVDWLKKVDAANLIADLFELVTENRHRYVKTRDSSGIMQVMLDENPELLREVFEFARLLVEVANRESSP